MAQAEVKVAGRIDVLPAHVWPYLADPGTLDQWLDGASQVKVTGSGEGATRRWRRGTRWIEDEVVELVPEQRLRLSIRGLSPLLDETSLRVELHPDDGGTRLEAELALGLRRWWMRLLRPWIALKGEIALLSGLRAFRSWVEEAVQASKRVDKPSGK